MKLRGAASGAVVVVGLVAGMLGGTGTASASSLGLLGTTTSLSVTPVSSSPDSVPIERLTATVTLAAVKGALVTPSGDVSFVTGYYTSDDGPQAYPNVEAKLSSCLLGLKPVGSLWQTTCTATTTIALTEASCEPTFFQAFYTGSSDLVAKASFSNLVNRPATCLT
jgi:hypothetical protein